MSLYPASLTALARDALEIAALLAIDAAFRAIEVVTAPAERVLYYEDVVRQWGQS